jgi:outer membrane receptor protein involved in Fe transport
MHKTKVFRAALLAVACSVSLAVSAQGREARAIDIPPGDLVSALDELARQSGAEFIYRADQLRGLRTPGAQGTLSVDEALQRLLRNSGFTTRRDPSGALLIIKGEQAPPPASAPAAPAAPPRPPASAQAPAQASEPVNLAEILVQGSRSLNADIRRTIDDPQPYVVFDRVDIERAGAINLNDFLLKRLSANTVATSRSQSGEVLGDRSAINLRGLGEGQTLVLVDGRRLSNLSAGFTTGQPNLNGIPLSAVERIEVLPTTASAIYGGSATGGVINIILRRGYEGGEIAISHDNSFETDSSINRVDFAYGFSLAGGRTSVLLNGSYSEANLLLNRDRDFFTRGMEHVLANNPDYLGLITPGFSTTPNLRSITGADLVLDNGTALGSPITFVPVGYRGPGSDGAAALVANAGRLNTAPSPLASIFGGGGSFGAAPRSESVAASVRHSFSDRLDGFLDLSHNQARSRQPNSAPIALTLPGDDPRNPFQQAIQVTVPTDVFNTFNDQFNRTDRASAGLIARLPKDWAASVDFTWSRSSIGYTLRPGFVDGARLLASGFNPLADNYSLGSFDLTPFAPLPVLVIGVPVTTYSYNPTLRAGGPLWQLPGGAVTVSLLLEQQKNEFGIGAQRIFPGEPNELANIFPPRSQDVRSAYVEFGIPLFGKDNARAGLRSLDLQLAVRHDDYRSISGNFVTWFPNSMPEPPPFVLVDNASAQTTGLVGLKYAPVNGLTLRASHGTGFVPPDVTQLGAPTRFEPYFSSTPDPRRGNTASPSPAVLIQGSNPDLEPEDSETTSIGVIVEPVTLPGFRASLDYTRLKKDNNITSITEAQLFQFEQIFPERIQRGSNLPGDPPGWAGPVTLIDTSQINAASSRFDSLDLQLKYGRYLDNGALLEFWGNATWTLKAEQRLLPTLDPVILRGISSGDGRSIPLNFRGFYGVDFEKGGWGLGWTVRHYSSYLVADPALASSAPILATQGNGGRVPRQFFHDLSVRWRPMSSPAGAGWKSALDKVELTGGIRNVFNKEPEVDLSNPFNFYSYLGDARLRTYYVQAKYMF